MAPVIEVAIALIAAFWVTSLAASAVVEWVSQNLLKKRANDLDVVLRKLLTGEGRGAGSVSQGANQSDPATAEDWFAAFKATSVFRAMELSSNKKRNDDYGGGSKIRPPSYMSARAFADAVVELLAETHSAKKTVSDLIEALPDKAPLRQRLVALEKEGAADLLAVKAGLEGWFDDSMDRLEGAYKRWSQWVLLCTGVLIAFVLNVSALDIVQDLWNDNTLRLATADQVLTNLPCPESADSCTNDERLVEVGLALPIGWSEEARPDPQLLSILSAVVGWLITGLATMLGAPFWFDVLGRIGNFRQARGVPPRAPDDPTSAASQRPASQQPVTFADAVLPQLPAGGKAQLAALD